MNLSHYWPEFLTVALVHLLAVASPGPDFAVIVRQSLNAGRRPALWTSLGIGTGILLHVSYCLLGLAVLLLQAPSLFIAVQVLCAAYLIWLGVQCLRAQPMAPLHLDGSRWQRAWPSFRLGFLTNALNGKATLYFLAVFTSVISPSTPLLIQSFYGVWMGIATAAWFMGLSVLLTHPRLLEQFRRHGHWIDRTTGLILLLLAVRVLIGLASA